MLGRRSLYVGAAVLVCAGLVWILVQWWRSDRASHLDSSEFAQQEPPRNTRPDVAYVGDLRCRSCHREIYERFRQHPMGRSLGPLTEVAALERFDADAHPIFTAAGFEYEVRRTPGGMVHRETRRDPKGQALGSREAEVRYALGSGARGRSYLIDWDGQLFLSPIAWYSQPQRWDLSPGYDKAHLHFERTVKLDCLFCHANRVLPVADTINQYEKPVFRGYAIGCERCHGPGELHVASHERADIVDPAKLEPVLRDGVCEQCHLLGEARIVRRGRQEFDYRPGLPLHDFLAIFVKAPELSSEDHAVSQVEQMAESQCYQKSHGKMGCIACHDPHGVPKPDEKVAFFRGRCLKCHGESAPECSLPHEARLQTNQDDCMSCHMPHFTGTDIAHTAVTDHRIRRRPEKHEPRNSRGTLLPWQSPLVAYHEKYLPPGQSLKRELALGQIQLGAPQPLTLPYLDESLETDPDDVLVLDAKGFVLAQQGNFAAAMKTFEKLLALAPEHEDGLAWAASLAEQLGMLDRAEDYWRRVLKVNRRFSNYHLGLARVLLRREQWQEAAREAQMALELNHTRLEARKVLLVCYSRLGEQDKMQAEWQIYEELRPPDLEEVRKLIAGKK